MKYLFVGLVFLYANFLMASEKEHLFVVSGVVVNSNNGKKIDNFIAMIAKKSGYKLKPYFVRSYNRLSEVLRDKPDALAWTCGAPFVQDTILDGQQLVAIPLYQGVPTYSSFIVVNKEDKEKSLVDYKGKIFVYSDPRSNSGFVAPAAVLKDAGYDINTFFSTKINAEIHERSIEAIYRGVADIGAIDEYVWIEYTKMHPKIKEKLHVIQKIGPFAFTPIVAGKSVSKSDINKIQKALLDMNQKELKTLKNDFNLDGFVVKDVSFYNTIKSNMQKIGVELQ